MRFDLSHQAAGEAVELWIPYPLSDDDQLITDIKIKGDYTESAVYSDQQHSTPMLYARWEKNAESRKLAFSFHAVRNEVVKKDFPAKESAWDPRDYVAYLSPTSLGHHRWSC